MIGENCIIRQNITIGGRNKDVPRVGNNVEIGTHAVLLGKIVIGDNARIGAKSLVLVDVPSNSTIVGLWK